VFGGAWADIPAYLQRVRGSHIVYHYFMFNFHKLSFDGFTSS